MKPTQNTCFCHHCKKQVTFHYEPVNHRKELLRTVITAGLWLPIWLFSVLAKSKTCDVCGETVLEE